MSALPIQVPFPVFQDRDGQPLDNGYVWIGEPNLNPQTNPVVAYFDKDLTIPAAQPLRTINGHVSNAGTPAQIYVDGVNFSILVQDRKGAMVYNFPDGSGISPNSDGVSFLQAGAGAVARTAQDKMREVVGLQDRGATGAAPTNTAAISQIAANQEWAAVPGETFIISENNQAGAYGLIGTNRSSKLVNTTALERTVMMKHGANRPNRGRVQDLQIEDTKADGSNDNYAAIFLYGVDDVSITGNSVSPCTVGISVQPGDASLGPYAGDIFTEDRNKCQSRNTVLAFNEVKSAGMMGYEMFSALRGRFIGNVADNEGDTKGTQHGFRFTGYAGMPCSYNAAVGNVSYNFANGISIQTATKYNTIAAHQVCNAVNGVTYNINTTSNAQYNGHNYVQAVVHSCSHGAYLYNPSYNHFNLIVDQATTTGVYLRKDNGSFGYAKNNLVDAIVTNSASAARIETDNNIVRITCATLSSNAIEITGNNNIVDVVVDDVSNAGGRFSLLVSGNKNIIRCLARSNNTPATADISVTGSDNHVTTVASTGVTCTGARNTLEGNLGNVTSLAGSTDTILRGTATSISRGGTNTDYTGIRGGSGRGQISTTSDVNGEATISVTGIPTGLTVMGAIAQYLNFTNGRYVIVKSCSVSSGTLTIVLRFRKDDGTAAASEAVFAFYQYFAY